MTTPSPKEVNLDVLEGIAQHLEDEGWYVYAIRVREAIDELMHWRTQK